MQMALVKVIDDYEVEVKDLDVVVLDAVIGEVHLFMESVDDDMPDYPHYI